MTGEIQSIIIPQKKVKSPNAVGNRSGVTSSATTSTSGTMKKAFKKPCTTDNINTDMKSFRNVYTRTKIEFKIKIWWN